MKHLSNWLVTGRDAWPGFTRAKHGKATTRNKRLPRGQDFVVWGNLETGDWEPYFCSL